MSALLEFAEDENVKLRYRDRVDYTDSFTSTAMHYIVYISYTAIM